LQDVIDQELTPREAVARLRDPSGQDARRDRRAVGCRTKTVSNEKTRVIQKLRDASWLTSATDPAHALGVLCRLRIVLRLFGGVSPAGVSFCASGSSTPCWNLLAEDLVEVGEAVTTDNWTLIFMPPQRVILPPGSLRLWSEFTSTPGGFRVVKMQVSQDAHHVFRRDGPCRAGIRFSKDDF